MILVDILWQDHLEELVRTLKSLRPNLEIHCSNKLSEIYPADLTIVATEDAVLVTPRARSQDVRLLVDRLRSAGRTEAHSHRTVYRPWGCFRSIDLGEGFQVKRITVKPGAKISLQKHAHRAEHWVVVQGRARVTRDNETIELKVSESATIPLGSVHRLENVGNELLARDIDSDSTDDFTLALANLVGDDFDLAGAALYADANGDGVPDDFTPLASTGPLAAGAAFRFVVAGNVPGTQTGGQVAQARITATSTFDGAQTAFNTDVTTVTGNAVVSVTKAISQGSGASPSGPYTYTLSYANTGNSTATGVRLTDLPLSPEKVLRALRTKENRPLAAE